MRPVAATRGRRPTKRTNAVWGSALSAAASSSDQRSQGRGATRWPQGYVERRIRHWLLPHLLALGRHAAVYDDRVRHGTACH